MANQNDAFFPARPKGYPQIYAYSDPRFAGQLKVGYTTIGVQERVRQQYPVILPGEHPYKIVVEESAMRADGNSFMDHDVHNYLERHGVECTGREWYRCTRNDVLAASNAVQRRPDE